MAGWLFLLAALAAGATYALTFTAYLEPLLPGLPPRTVGVVLVLVALALNLRGVRLAARANATLVIVKLAILVVFVLLALPTLNLGRMQPLFIGGVSGVLQATALLFFAYSGYARPITIAEEVQEPATTLPRVVIISMALTTTLYVAVALAGLGTLGPEGMGADAAPLRAVMEAVGSPIGAALISLGALVATSTVLITEIWGLSRLGFAMARNGDLPTIFARLAGPERVPRNAVLAAGLILLLFTSLADLRPALEASSLGLLFYYGVMNISALRMPADRRLYPPIVPILGLTATVFVAFSLPIGTLLAVSAVGLVGLGYYVLRQRR
jgi:APA family basic amino acid/polyamine antiporter